MDINIIWFKNDLRLNDNPMVDGSRLVGLYIINEAIKGYSRWFTWETLKIFEKSLEKYGIPLIICQENQWEQVLNNLNKQFNIQSISFNKSYESHWIPWQESMVQWGQNHNIALKTFHNNTLMDPMAIKNQTGGNYKVFTPFWKNLSALDIPKPVVFHGKTQDFFSVGHDNNHLWASYQVFLKDHEFLHEYWCLGEKKSHEILDSFIKNNLINYKNLRDFPHEEINSRLSPYLRTGVITARQIYWQVKKSHIMESIGEPFLRQLGWRDFAFHLLAHYPHMPQQNLRPEFNDFPWVSNETWLNQWKNGQTGYPIVDASMNQLKKSGWIHNRVRMIVASFLTKDLRIHWTQGEQHFWEYLVDADEANNSASWQWVSGCGADAAPYFRIFNPVLQSQKFDPHGYYIKKWVPKLAHVHEKKIHDPWNHGVDYYPPMVDHQEAKAIALASYKKITHDDETAAMEDGI
jgi:deoxyribodipyrimidine photo-lyase